jgi:hypothetical protein
MTNELGDRAARRNWQRKTVHDIHRISTGAFLLNDR